MSKTRCLLRHTVLGLCILFVSGCGAAFEGLRPKNGACESKRKHASEFIANPVGRPGASVGGRWQCVVQGFGPDYLTISQAGNRLTAIVGNPAGTAEDAIAGSRMVIRYDGGVIYDLELVGTTAAKGSSLDPGGGCLVTPVTCTLTGHIH